MSFRRIINPRTVFQLAKEKKETWPVIGCMGVALSLMVFESANHLMTDSSVRINPTHRSNEAFYLRETFKEDGD